MWTKRLYWYKEIIITELEVNYVPTNIVRVERNRNVNTIKLQALSAV